MLHYTYNAWGVVSSSVNSSLTGDLLTAANGLLVHNPYVYKGYYYDSDTGYYYLKSRYYDPRIHRFLSADKIDYLDPKSLSSLNLYVYCGDNPVMMMDENGTIPRWLEVTIGISIIVAAVALSIVTAGLVAAPIAAGLGGGMFGAIAGGAIAGGIGGAITGFGISLGVQGVTNGFDDVDWNQVGKSTLSGAISGFVTGGVFGAIRYVADATKVANSISGLSKAQTNLDKAFAPLKSIKAFSGMPFSSSNIARIVGQTASNYNSAYSALVNAQVVNAIVKFAFYPTAQFLFKQVVGYGINQII